MANRPIVTAPPPFTRRRTPRQKRSRILYDRILATAKALFEQEGYANVTTNRIAERARTSIGSLYQYFKNRESIALAVYETACAEAALAQKQRTLASLSLPIGISIPKHIEEVFGVFEKNRYALVQLLNEVPTLRDLAQPSSFDSLIRHTTQIFLEQHFAHIDSATIARKAYVINKCVLGLIGEYMEDRPEFLSRTDAIGEAAQVAQLYIENIENVIPQGRRIRSRRARRRH